MRYCVAILLLILPAFSTARASSSSRREHGAAVFASSGCSYCHTIQNVGGHQGPDLSDVGDRKTKAEIRRQIVHGSKIMPAFGKILPSSDISDLIAYLRSCREKH